MTYDKQWREVKGVPGTKVRIYTNEAEEEKPNNAARRREVARRLRGNPEDTLIPHRTGRHYGMGCREAADRFWDMCDRIKEAGDYDIAWSTCSVLADLIDPGIPADPGEAGLASVDGFIREMRHSTKEEQDEYEAMLEKMSVELYPVDRDALLALADEMDGDSVAVPLVKGSYQSGYVAAMRDYAGRIRETCGSSGENVSMSAYDLLPEGDREALRWVRDHGGLDALRRRVDVALARETVAVGACSLLGMSDDSDARDVMCALKSRLMPDGCEWPRYEDGELVLIGDVVLLKNDLEEEVHQIFFHSSGFELYTDTSEVDYSYGERVKRPRPKVLAADGEPLEVGQTVWRDDGEELEVLYLRPDGLVDCCGEIERPESLTHQRPVLDAEGVPIKVGDTVWHIETGREYVVVEPSYGETVVVCLVKYDDAEGEQYAPDQLTHTKPEPPDSWERIDEDKALNPFDYCKKVGHKLWTFDNAEEFKASDLVRRCKALAGRDA